MSLFRDRFKMGFIIEDNKDCKKKYKKSFVNFISNQLCEQCAPSKDVTREYSVITEKCYL